MNTTTSLMLTSRKVYRRSNCHTTRVVSHCPSNASHIVCIIYAENPYTAAQRFLQNNELPLTYLDEVVRFIEKNTQGVSLGGGGEFVDPFTGRRWAVHSGIQLTITQARHDTNRRRLQLQPVVRNTWIHLQVCFDVLSSSIAELTSSRSVEIPSPWSDCGTSTTPSIDFQ